MDRQFTEENTAYSTKRAAGYSRVNQEELATGQRAVWRSVLLEAIQARFPQASPGDIRVLDVGTGPGFFAIILAEQGYQVTAVDCTASMLAEARRNAGPLRERIGFLQMDAEKRHRRDRENVRRSGVEDDTAGTDVDAMEAIARRTYLASRKRPEWDLDVLGRLGLEPRADREVWQRVWTEAERVNNASTPMFMIHAVKRTL